ncbi:hypothetical protein LOAG_12751 [Loa loa]|uniref:Uncharacterized protein n=1 Tax=Loa loa TaxID=7209 RepID=A0A1S0TL46_LOALO|nr:hypothetical protein LOAG_12751 [Loa loa]EFO15758.2 hypothetical protein LOAG_12751 [Loa loa]
MRIIGKSEPSVAHVPHRRLLRSVLPCTPSVASRCVLNDASMSKIPTVLPRMQMRRLLLRSLKQSLLQGNKRAAGGDADNIAVAVAAVAAAAAVVVVVVAAIVASRERAASGGAREVERERVLKSALPFRLPQRCSGGDSDGCSHCVLINGYQEGQAWLRSGAV